MFGYEYSIRSRRFKKHFVFERTSFPNRIFALIKSRISQIIKTASEKSNQPGVSRLLGFQSISFTARFGLPGEAFRPGNHVPHPYRPEFPLRASDVGLAHAVHIFTPAAGICAGFRAHIVERQQPGDRGFLPAELAKQQPRRIAGGIARSFSKPGHSVSRPGSGHGHFGQAGWHLGCTPTGRHSHIQSLFDQAAHLF